MCVRIFDQKKMEGVDKMELKTIVLGLIIFIWCISALKTVTQNQNASKPCFLGYRSLSAFTPLSTAFA